MFTDLGNLVAAVSSVSAGDIAIVASPAQWSALTLKAGSPPPFPILYSAGLADGDVVALALPALVIAMDEAPQISVSDTAVVHFEDTTPLQLGTIGTPNTVAAPSISLFQVDAVGLRDNLARDLGLARDHRARVVTWRSGGNNADR